jgi:hypothetical protein
MRAQHDFFYMIRVEIWQLFMSKVAACFFDCEPDHVGEARGFEGTNTRQRR